MLTPDLEEDLQVALDFLRAVTGEENPLVTFQVFDDKGENHAPAKHKHGTLAECWNWLEAKNAAGSS